MIIALDKGLELEDNDMKTLIRGRIKLYIRDHVKPVVITMDKEAGHTIRWSPAHHYGLQTIELVWKNVKGTVGRQYTTTTTLEDVRSRLNSEFAILDTKTVYGCIKKDNNILEELLDHIMAM